MKRFLFVILILLTSTSVLDISDMSAQVDDCDPSEVRTWIQQRQTWRQASQDTLDAQGVGINIAMAQLADHLQAIEDLSRPTCANEAMLWTYYLYTNLQHLLICAQVSDSACSTEMQTRLADYRERDDQIMAALASGASLPSSVLQPPTPTPAPTATPAPQTQRLGPIRDSIYDETYSVEIGVSNVRFMKKSDYAEAKTGFVYVAADVTVKNLGPGSIRSLYVTSFQVRDANGALRQSDYFPEVMSCGFDLVDLMSGGLVSGCIGFEVPEAGSIELIYAPYQYEGLEAGRYLSFRLR